MMGVKVNPDVEDCLLSAAIIYIRIAEFVLIHFVCDALCLLHLTYRMRW